MIWTRILAFGGAVSCNGSMGSSSIETMFTKDPEGPVAWQGNGFASTFWAVGGATSIAPLSIKLVSCSEGPNDCLCRAPRYPYGRHIRHFERSSLGLRACHGF